MVAEQVQKQILIVNSKELSDVLKRFRPLIKQNPTIPAHEHIMFTREMEGDVYVFGGTSERNRTEMNTITVDGDFQSFCPEYLPLAKLVDALPDQPLKITFDGKCCKVKSTTGAYRIPAISTEDYPVIEKSDKGDVFMLATAPEIAESLKLAKPFFGQNIDFKPAMDGAWLVPSPEGTAIVATNDRMIYIDRIDGDPINQSTQIRHDAADFLIKIMETGACKVDASGSWLTITNEEEDCRYTELSVRQLYTTYGSLHEIMERVEKLHNQTITANRLAIVTALRRLRSLPYDEILGHKMTLRMENGNMILDYRYTDDYECSETIDCEYEGGEIKWQISFNTADLETCLNTFESEQVAFRLNTENRVAIGIKAVDSSHRRVLIMPMVI